jgi:hypothetical protein
VRCVWLGAVVLAACGSPTKAPPTPRVVEPAAVEILSRMEQAYGTATTYLDRGLVSTTFSVSGTARVVEKPFEIAFVRGTAFRFEFREGGSTRSYIVWWDGKRALTSWYARPGITEVATLGLALAGATGVSSSSAHTTPRLLLPDLVGGFSFSELRNPRVLGTEPIANRACWRMVGEHPRSAEDLTFWIDRQTYLLRRTARRVRFPAQGGRPEFTTESTTTYDPVVNERLDPERLKPPDEAPSL